jgi:hypothetical protein
MRAGREFGSKIGSGGVASAEMTNAERRERLRQLALETIGLTLHFPSISSSYFCFQ